MQLVLGVLPVEVRQALPAYTPVVSPVVYDSGRVGSNGATVYTPADATATARNGTSRADEQTAGMLQAL